MKQFLSEDEKDAIWAMCVRALRGRPKAPGGTGLVSNMCQPSV